MAEAKEVCKICYNSSSHKPNPTLTFEPQDCKGTSDNHKLLASGTKQCVICLQEWVPIRVAKELHSARWVRIRPRPKLLMHIEFMMCKNLNSRNNDCSRGQYCSFAHSQAELWVWNQERQKEPRPAPRINGSYQYQLCRSISKTGSCSYGSKCTFAHTEEELESWLNVQEQAGIQANLNITSASAGTPIYRCNSKRQLAVHSNSSRLRQMHVGGRGGGGVVGRGEGFGGGNIDFGRGSRSFGRGNLVVGRENLGVGRGNGGVGRGGGGFDGGSGWFVGSVGTSARTKVYTGNNLRTNGNVKVRPMPALSFYITSYRLCVHIQKGCRCLYGDYCTFAHSQAELDEWNKQIMNNSTVQPSRCELFFFPGIKGFII